MMRERMIKRMCLGLVLLVGLANVSQAADPVALWKLDDGTGNTSIDSSGNGYDGTVGGDAVWVDGKYGGGLQFSSGGWVDLPIEVWNDVLMDDSTISFCFFHYIDAIEQTTDFGAGPGRTFQSHLPWSTGNIYFDIAGTGRDTAVYQDEWLGQWNHFCYMYAP